MERSMERNKSILLLPTVYFHRVLAGFILFCQRINVQMDRLMDVGMNGWKEGVFCHYVIYFIKCEVSIFIPILFKEMG